MTTALTAMHWSLSAGNGRLLSAWHPETRTPLGVVFDEARDAAGSDAPGVRESGIKLSGCCAETGTCIYLRIRHARKTALADIIAYSADDTASALRRYIGRDRWLTVMADLVAIAEDLSARYHSGRDGGRVPA